MIPDGLEGAHGKGWSDREAEDNGWGEGRGGGATACGETGWEGEGLHLDIGQDPGTETL